MEEIQGQQRYKNNPKLRFSGFSQAWEQRKLGEVSVKVTEKNKDFQFTETLTNSAEYGIIIQRKFFDKDISNKENLNGYYIVRQDNFVYNPRISNFAPVGPINRNKLGIVGVMSPLYYVFKTYDINSNYLEHYFNGTGWHRFMKLNGDSGARSDRFSIKDNVLVTMPIPCPSLPEQASIGSLFLTLDTLITAQHKKVEQLRTLKKGLLQKMFVVDGADKPEVRFDGYTDAWEQRKLGEVAEHFEYGLNVAATEYDGENKYLRITDIDEDTGILKTDSLTSPNIDLISVEKYKLREGDILFARTGASVGKTYRYVVTDGSVYYAGFLIRAKIKFDFDCKFVYQNTLTNRYKKYIALTSQRSGQPGVNAREYSNFEFWAPKTNEQSSIGNLFSTLDQLIALHQRKCEQLQQLKKALLQQMFV